VNYVFNKYYYGYKFTQDNVEYKNVSKVNHCGDDALLHDGNTFNEGTGERDVAYTSDRMDNCALVHSKEPLLNNLDNEKKMGFKSKHFDFSCRLKD